MLGIVVLVLLVGWVIGRVMPVVLPFAVAILLATLLRPLAERMERRGARPAAAACIVVVGAVLVLLLLLTLILPPFVARLTDLGSSLEEGVQRVGYEIGARFGMDHADVNRTLDDAANRLRSRAGGTAMAVSVSLAGALASVVLVFFLSFFLVKDGRRMWTWSLELVPERRRDTVNELGERAWTVLTAYTRGVVFVATVDAVLIGAALLIIGVPLALPLIVLTWLAAFFPIIGAIAVGRGLGPGDAGRRRPDRGADRARLDRGRAAGGGQHPLSGRRRPAAEAAPDRRARLRRARRDDRGHRRRLPGRADRDGVRRARGLPARAAVLPRTRQADTARAFWWVTGRM